MDAANDILDSSWIANILSICFSLVIFLGGVPVLFMQTYVPEELRKYYDRINSNNMKDLLWSAFFLLLAITIFGNHGFKYLVKKIFYKHYFSLRIGDYLYNIHTEDALICLYISSFIFFIYVTYYIYKRFISTVFRKENIKKQIIDSIFYDYKNLVTNKGISYKNNDQLSELRELSVIFNSGIDRVNFYDQFFILIATTVEHSSYSGREIGDYFEHILYPIFVKDFVNTNSTEQNKIIHLCEVVAGVYRSKEIDTNYDRQYITDIFLFQLYTNFVYSENIDYAKRCINCMRKFKINETILFKIYYHAFHHHNYAIIMDEIKMISINLPNSELVKPDKLYNYIAYLSFFYNENEVGKEYVNEWLVYLRECRYRLAHEEILRSKNYFMKISKIETAQKIDKFLNAYPSILNKINFQSAKTLAIIIDKI